MLWQKLTIAGIGMAGVLMLVFGINYQNRQEVFGVVTPLADDYSSGASYYQQTLDKFTAQNSNNSYFPASFKPKFTDPPEISAAAYAALERQSRELLLAKDLTQEYPIASITKIMTALVVLDKADLETEVKISSAAASTGEAEMGVNMGEILTIEELLYGMMLPSGNDAAEALAEATAGSRQNFILAMNQQAHDLGLFDTFYFNPTGLDGQVEGTSNFSTAWDLLALTNYALNQPKFAEICSTSYKELPYKPGKHKAFFLHNRLQMEKSYPGIKGVKPGTTAHAKEALVSYAENGGKQVILVLLQAENSRTEAIKIYDYLFDKLGVKINKL